LPSTFTFVLQLQRQRVERVMEHNSVDL